MHTTPTIPRKRGAAAILTTFGLAAGCFVAVPLAQFVDRPEPPSVSEIDSVVTNPPPPPFVIPPEPEPKKIEEMKQPVKPPLPVPIIEMLQVDLNPTVTYPVGDPSMWIPKSEPIYLPEQMDSPPEAVFQVTPNPRSRATGTVKVKLIVDTFGNVTDVSVIGLSDPVLDQACREAAAKWRFKPGYVGGVPVRFQVIVPFQFKSR